MLDLNKVPQIKNLNYFLDTKNLKSDVNHIDLFEREMNGGKIAKQTIDRIKEYPNKTSIAISGLRQNTFEYFINTYGQQFEHITLWKCPLISDLTPIGRLPHLKFLIIYWIQKATTFWDLSKTSELRGLSLNDTLKLDNFTELGKSRSITELRFGDAIDSKLKLQSLSPIGKMIQLESLNFNAKQIIDNDITPLANLQNLKNLSISLHLFTTEQFAWLKAKLPKELESRSLKPYYRFNTNSEKDTIIIGKGKPVLNWEKDQNKIKKYVEVFEKLVLEYKK